MAEEHKIAISTISMGWHENHTLDDKLEAASAHGYNGIELFWSDLEKDAVGRNIIVEDNAARIGSKCKDLGLGISDLASFDNFEGCQKVPLETRLEKARRWVSIARILGTDIVQIPANDDLSSLAASEDECVAELRMLADIGASRGGQEKTITWAYEPMAWSARDFTWQAALHTVRRVARPNVKLCLDTYHILAKLWGDCTVPDGKVPGGDEALRASLHDLPRMIRPEEVAFVQLSDAEHIDPPVALPWLHDIGKHQSHYWCSWGRLFPYEKDEGAYLPMEQICNTLLRDLCRSGWVSMEIFHRSMRVMRKGPDQWAERGMKSWKEVQKMLQD